MKLRFVDGNLIVLRLIETALSFEQRQIVDGAGIKTRFGDVVRPLRFRH